MACLRATSFLSGATDELGEVKGAEAHAFVVLEVPVHERLEALASAVAVHDDVLLGRRLLLNGSSDAEQGIMRGRAGRLVGDPRLNECCEVVPMRRDGDLEDLDFVQMARRVVAQAAARTACSTALIAASRAAAAAAAAAAATELTPQLPERW